MPCCYSQFVHHLAKWGLGPSLYIPNSISTTPAGEKKKKSNLSSTTCTERVKFNPMEWREGKAFANYKRHSYLG